MCVAIGGCLLTALMTRGAANLLLWDDNLNQWLPVADTAFSTLLRGELPTLNPYQLLGAEVVDLGYYGVLNPLMFLAYIIRSAIPLGQSTISVYIYLCEIIGVLVAYAFGRNIGLGILRSACIGVAFVTVSPYLLHGQWYYVFNNVVVIPLLLLVVYELTQRPERHGIIGGGALGTLLAVSIFQGNIQYTMYHFVIVAGLVSGFLLLSKNRLAWLSTGVAAVLIAAALGFPLLVLMARISERAAGAFGAGTNPLYYAEFVSPLESLVSYLIPFRVSAFRAVAHAFPPPYSDVPGGYHDYSVFYIGPLAFLSLAGAIRLLRRERSGSQRDTGLSILVAVTLGIAVLAWWNMAGDHSLPARLLFFLPGFSRFRFLVKWTFVVPPLLLVPACYALAVERRPVQFGLLCGALFFIVLGILNARDFFAEHSGFSPPDVSGIKALGSQGNADLQDYRIAGFNTALPGGDFVNLGEKLARNGATYAQVFTPGGYQPGIATDNLQLLFPLFPGETYAAVFNLLDVPLSGLSEDHLPQLPAATIRDLDGNLRELALKYLIVDQGQPNERQLLALLHRTPTVSYGGSHGWIKRYRIVELDGVKKLGWSPQDPGARFAATFGHLELTSSVSGFKDAYLQFAYRPFLQCSFAKTESAAEAPCVVENVNGMMHISLPAPAAGTVRVRYRSWLHYVGFLNSLLAVSLLCFFLWKLFRRTGPDAGRFSAGSPGVVAT